MSVRTTAGASVVVVCLCVFGCGDHPAAPLASAPELTPDEKVLRVLDCYDPVYRVDADGRVTRLRLSWRHLPPPIVAEIATLTELRNLDLAFSTITDDGLAQLKDLQNLRSMGLSGTPVTDRGVAYLEKLQGLQYVWLSKQTISKAAVDKLKDARPDMHVYWQ
jgi:hypothetical protein